VKKIKIIATAVVVAVPITVAAVGISLIKRHMRKKSEKGRKGRHLLPDNAREPIEELLLLKGQELVPDKLGKTLLERKLDSMSDRNIILLYALVKVGEVIQARGISVHGASKEDVHEALATFSDVTSKSHARKDLLAELARFGFEVWCSMLQDGLQLVAAQQ
jgi:hypothetical protein